MYISWFHLYCKDNSQHITFHIMCRYDIVIRQALYGGAYSLIDENMQPLPDFWLSYLFKKLVGRRSLEVSVTQNPGNIRVYASCSR